MTYLNLLNSRNGEDESNEILLSYIQERNKGILIGSGFLTLSFLILLSIIIKGFLLDYRKRIYLNDVITYNETILKIQYLKNVKRFPSSYWFDKRKLDNYMLPTFTKKVVKYLEKK